MGADMIGNDKAVVRKIFWRVNYKGLFFYI